MKNIHYNKINIIYYINLILYFIILFIPVNYKFAVYGPNWLGWIQIISIPLSFILILWLSILDFRKKRNKIIIRLSIYITVIFISIIYWFYKTNN